MNNVRMGMGTVVTALFLNEIAVYLSLVRSR